MSADILDQLEHIKTRDEAVMWCARAANEIKRLRKIESAAFTVVNADAQSDHQHVIDEWISELRKTLSENR